MERVEAAGGNVINWDGCRVLGVLATSRSIGTYVSSPHQLSMQERTLVLLVGGSGSHLAAKGLNPRHAIFFHLYEVFES